MERPPFRRALQLPRAPPLRRALPLRWLCLLCLLPLASGLLDLYDDTFEERIEAEPVLLILLYQPCSKTHCNNDGPCEDLPPSQNDLFAPVFEAAAAELGDEIPLARINGNLVERAVQQYGSQETLYYGAVGVAPRRTRGLLGTCSPELVVFRHGRDYRFRGPGLPTQPELVSYMRTEAELARRAAPSTMQLAWHGLADEISRLNPAGETEIPRFDRTIDTLGMDSAGRLLKISERPDGRRKAVLPNPGYHERNWVAASLPLHGALTEEALRETHLAHFVGAPQYTKMLAKSKLRLPTHTLFALYFLYQRFGEGREYADPLWQAWLHVQRLARTGQHALFFWSEDELALLEEERLIDMAKEWRESVSEQYTKLVVPLCELFPYFFPPEKIKEADYARAVAMVGAHLLSIPAVNGSALLPLPMRQSPTGSVTPSHVVETGTGARARRSRDIVSEEIIISEANLEAEAKGYSAQNDEEDYYEDVAAAAEGGDLGEVEGDERHIVHLLHANGQPMAPGSELTLGTAPPATARHNDQLLLEAGTLWDDLACASVPLRFQLDVDTMPESPTRRKLLKAAGLDPARYDWKATVGPVAEELMTWTRIMLAPAEELEPSGRGLAAQLDAMRRPLSLSTETDVVNNLLSGMERIYAQYDHNVEEDELILAKRDGLSARYRLAVQQRRLSKLVLERQAKNLNELLEHAAAEERKRANTGAYSTSKARRQRADKVSQKEAKREKTRAARKAKVKREL